MSGTAAHEYTDDPSAFAAESQARARRWLAADRVVSALIHAAHALPRTQRLPTRESHAEHVANVAHFAALVREARALPEWLGGQRAISPARVRAMHSRGVLVSEVEACV